MRRIAQWAVVALALALAGAAHADPREVGRLDDDYGATVRVYLAGDIVGVSVYDREGSHIALLTRAQADKLATLLEGGWAARMSHSSNAIHGTVMGQDGHATVAIMADYQPVRVSLSVTDSDTGLGASFWSNSGAVRYIANTLRRAAK